VIVSKSTAAPTAEADSGYGAPSSSYGAPSYEAPSYKKPSYEAPSYEAPSYDPPKYKRNADHTHHHFYHYDDYRSGGYRRPSSYRRPYEHERRPSTYDQRRPSRYAPNYDYYGYGYDGEDPYLHIHKEEAVRSALLFGVGLIKGVAVTALINSANNGITIGK